MQEILQLQRSMQTIKEGLSDGKQSFAWKSVASHWVYALVQNHQIDQLKEEISGKDLALVKEHFDHMKVRPRPQPGYEGFRSPSK